MLRPLAQTTRTSTRNVLSPISRRTVHIFARPRPKSLQPVLWGAAFVLSMTALSFKIRQPVHLDIGPLTPQPEDEGETITDPATSIAFPTTLLVPAKIKTPPMSLIGVGVRTVSFLGIKVYSVGFYADLENPNLTVAKGMTPDEKIDHIVRNTACVVRIVPVRTTSYTHLRDAFMRALHARMAAAKQQGTLSEEEATAIGSPLRKLKSLFPNSPLNKHTPLDVFLSPPIPGRPRVLVFRDLGAIEDDWVATGFVLHYLEGSGPSPPLKKSVVDRLESFEK